MDDHEDRVNDLLEQCVDHAALRFSTEPSDALDADLLARLQRLKAAPLASNSPLSPHVGADGLQSDLAERLAALKKDPSKAPAPEIIKTAKISNPNRTTQELREGDAFEVEKLLESVHDSVRLEKSGTSKSNHNNESDEEASDSEVDHIVEWAKDAAVLEEDEEDDVADADLPTTQHDVADADLSTTPTAAQSPQRKKKGSRWKFW